MSDTVKTLADYIEETKVEVIGAPDYVELRRLRMRKMIFDGIALETYELNAKRDKEGNKRFIELQWLAIALIGCDADFGIKEIRTLKTRQGMATPDFEAITHSGETIRIELCRITDGEEKRVLNAMRSIVSHAYENLAKNEHPILQGEFTVRFHDGIPPEWSNVKVAANELTRFIREGRQFAKTSTILHPAGIQYPMLSRLGIHVAHLTSNEPFKLSPDPPRFPSDTEGALKLFLENFENKKSKFKDYSNGYPVWLVFVVESIMSRFLPLAVVQAARDLVSFDPRPFQHVFIGCLTAGITFHAPPVPPRYTSLSASG